LNTGMKNRKMMVGSCFFLLVISLDHHPILSRVVQGKRSVLRYILERIRTGTAPEMVLLEVIDVVQFYNSSAVKLSDDKNGY
jgi:hypothetical protein